MEGSQGDLNTGAAASDAPVAAMAQWLIELRNKSTGFQSHINQQMSLLMEGMQVHEGSLEETGKELVQGFQSASIDMSNFKDRITQQMQASAASCSQFQKMTTEVRAAANLLKEKIRAVESQHAELASVAERSQFNLKERLGAVGSGVDMVQSDAKLLTAYAAQFRQSTENRFRQISSVVDKAIREQDTLGRKRAEAVLVISREADDMQEKVNALSTDIAMSKQEILAANTELNNDAAAVAAVTAAASVSGAGFAVPLAPGMFAAVHSGP